MQLQTRQTLLIRDILYVLGLAKTLLFVALIMTTSHTIFFFKRDKCTIRTYAPHLRVSMTYYIPKKELFFLGNGIEASTTSYITTTSTITDKETFK